MAMGLFYRSLGHHVAAWRDPAIDAGAHFSMAHFREIAQLAEAACFDFMFTADFLALFGADDRAQWSRTLMASRHEPLTMSAALAAMTERIGLISTVSTTFCEPMHVARMFASLDQISGGRAGWNVVTSATPSEAENFGMDRLPSSTDRYDRAEEFVDVVTGLWDSWEADAYLGDRRSGLFVDETKIHELWHSGRHFRVRGPLPIPRSPQGRPVIVQAGTSGPGRALAGRVAEVVFCVQQTLDSARAYARDIRSIAAANGRDPAQVKVMPGVMIVVAPTTAEAEDRYAALQALIPDVVGVAQLSGFMGTDLSAFPPDGPMPELDRVPDIGHGRMMYDIARAEGLTIREAWQRFAGQRGHRVVLGDPVRVADALAEWFEAGACDGFNVMPPTFPRDLRAICDLLVPELRRRGLMRTAYEGRTLREHLGLPVPRNRWG